MSSPPSVGLLSPVLTAALRFYEWLPSSSPKPIACRRETVGEHRYPEWRSLRLGAISSTFTAPDLGDSGGSAATNAFALLSFTTPADCASSLRHASRASPTPSKTAMATGDLR